MSKVPVYIPYDTYNVQVLWKYWNPTWAHGLMIPAGTRIHEGELWRPISGSRLGLDMVPPRKVSLRLSQSDCALVCARDAVVLWCTTSATSATHQQIDKLTIILVTEVIRVAARNISVSCMPLLAETLVSLGVVPLRSLGLRACDTLNSKHL